MTEELFTAAHLGEEPLGWWMWWWVSCCHTINHTSMHGVNNIHN